MLFPPIYHKIKIESEVTIAKKNEKVSDATPFLKWAGGKSQLLSEIRPYYPFASNPNITKYAEPFVGGGAVLFDILNRYDLKEVYISDINAELINTYLVVRDHVDKLINFLRKHQETYLPLDHSARKQYYSEQRNRFNTLRKDPSNKVELAALMIFLNRTCFNGLYRVNRHGDFNVPMGAYKNPLICNADNLKNASKKLQNVEIVCGDYQQSADFIDDHTFVYFDPPYRPLTHTANFTSYTATQFDDDKQLELAKFIQMLDNEKRALIVLSNSDPKNVDQNDHFFDDAYLDQNIHRVSANRMINRDPSQRGKIYELLISNYQKGIS